jgi:tetratricopeptide (TPR) repeat protein
MSYVPAAVLQRPTALHTGVGNSRERVTTTSRDAQAFYDQGLNYLESYVWIEASRSFRQALRADPMLAMAWVGVSRVHSGLDDTTAAWAALRQAQALAAGASRREQRRIRLRASQLDAISALTDTLRHQAYKRAIDSALTESPDDIPLLVIRGNAEEPTAAGRGQRGTARSVAYYQRVLELQPDHATAHHYLVHTYETIGNIDKALAHGEQYASHAAEIPHAHHMWGHDLRRVGRMDEAIAQFVIADSLERRYYRIQDIPPDLDWHHAHNLDLLAGCYQWQGRVTEARGVLERVEALGAPNSYSQANRRSLPLLLLGAGDFAGAAATARAMRATSELPSTLALSHALAGQAELRLGRIALAAAELAAADSALAHVPLVTPGLNVRRLSVQPYVDELRGELWLLSDRAKQGAALLEQVVRAYRAVPGPDAWSQALFRIEYIGSLARVAGEQKLAAIMAREMADHDPHYGGTHLALALLARDNADRAAAARELSAALAAWRLADPAVLQQATTLGIERESGR